MLTSHRVEDGLMERYTERKLDLSEVIKQANVCKMLDDDSCAKIGQAALDGYNTDVTSRSRWTMRQARANKLALQVYEQKTRPWVNAACYSLDTEILTDAGWKPIGDVEVGSKVYSRDEMGRASFCSVSNVFRHVADEMVHFVGKSVDLLVTKNHRMYAQDSRGRIRFMEAGELLYRQKKDWKLPLTSMFTGRIYETIHGIPAKAYVRFLGWYLSEGSHARQRGKQYFRKRQGGFVEYPWTTGSFQISQSPSVNPAKFAQIKSDIAACGFTCRDTHHGVAVHAKSMPLSAKVELRDLGLCDQKYIPRYILNLDPILLVELLDTLIAGDGSIAKNGHRTYYTSSKQLADDVQELCQKIGLRARIGIREPVVGGVIKGRQIIGAKTGYEVSINEKKWCQFGKLHRSLVYCNQEVACVEVEPHHVVYVRRNGKPVWCGNSVKFPLITVAALQHHSRAYAALVGGNDLVKCKTFGQDPDGSKSARAERIAEHMTWQNLEQDEAWEEDQDKLLLVQSIAGCAFKKRVYEPGPRRQLSMLVLPEDFVINYNSKSIHDSPRYTHRFNLTNNNIKQREMDGRFRKPDTKIEPVTAETTELSDARDTRQGLTEPPVEETITPFTTGEQAVWIDLDGDGYEEPYLVTFDISTGILRRIAPRFLPSGVREISGNIYKKGGSVYKITPVPMFVKYPFIPSPDGGFYDLGLGSLLGPLNETANTAINQMLDAGTMATLGGGFLGRGFKGKGGPITFEPQQWYPVDAPGDDLRKNILPLPVREPSNVLFQLLGFIVQYAERIVSATELQVGENIGQNTPAQTAQTMNENGSRVYNAIYKRTWRAERDEFRLQYRLNALYLDADVQYQQLTSGATMMVRPDDYLQDDINVRPAADPHVVSDNERLRSAAMLVDLSMKSPGYNRYQAQRRFLIANKIENIDEVLPPPTQPGPDGQPQPAKDFPPIQNPKMMDVQVKEKKVELEGAKLKFAQQQAAVELQMEAAESQARIMEMQASAAKMLAEANVAKTEPAIKMLFAQIEAEGKHRDRFLKAAEMIMNSMKETSSGDGKSENQSGGDRGMAKLAQQHANTALLGVPGSNGSGAPVGLA